LALSEIVVIPYSSCLTRIAIDWLVRKGFLFAKRLYSS